VAWAQFSLKWGTDEDCDDIFQFVARLNKAIHELKFYTDAKPDEFTELKIKRLRKAERVLMMISLVVLAA